MKLYLAPLEGITGYVYRQAYHACYEDADKYFTPFLAPHTKRSFNARERNDLIPEHNAGMYTVQHADISIKTRLGMQYQDEY